MKLFRLGYWMLRKGFITPMQRTQLREQGEDPSKWHICNHDVYGKRFWVTLKSTGEIEANTEDFEQYLQEDDIEDISDK